MLISKLLSALLGAPQKEPDPLTEDAGIDIDSHEEEFVYYSTFDLKDGHLLAQELEKLELPFEVELDDGISQVNMRFGSNGQSARMSIYVQKRDFDILADLVKLHFHY